MNKAVLIIAIIIVFLFGNMVSSLTLLQPKDNSVVKNGDNPDPLFVKFQRLSQQANSSCSKDFRDSIATMSDTQRLQGSCCSKMIFHRYREQIEGLKKYSSISQIPSDPYDIPAHLAKKLLGYEEDIILTSEEQKEYDNAMNMSDEKGPCCCKCWRWYVYEGLAKYLIRNKKFTGEQVAEVWNLSDGCGGDRHVPGAHAT